MYVFSCSVSAFPMKDIYNNLDITSFNSSLMPLRKGEERTFKDFNKKLPIPIFSEKNILLDDDYWTYSLTVIKASSDNDYYVCFKDKAKMGTYDSQKPMIIRDHILIQISRKLVITSLSCDIKAYPNVTHKRNTTLMQELE